MARLIYALAMALFLVLIFIVLPIAELYVIIKVGEAIGILPTIALLILDSFLGAALLRSQGRAAWRRFNEALAAGRIPTREVFDGAMVILGGAFLITPGFITDVIGILLLVPPQPGGLPRPRGADGPAPRGVQGRHRALGLRHETRPAVRRRSDRPLRL